MIMICDCNAKSKQWCKIDKTSFEGSQLQLQTTKFGLSQIITESTHILVNSRSCIDLLFVSQPNMVLDAEVLVSLHPCCHHRIIFIHLLMRDVWHFSQVNSDHMNRTVNLFDWESTLTDLGVNEQISVFNDTITNISNFVPNKIIICDDCNPPSVNRHIKNLILYKDNFLYVEKQYVPYFNF